VFGPGGYVENIRLDAQDTSATRLYFHGGGATLSAASGENSTLFLEIASTVRDLHFSGPESNAAITLYNGPHVIERVKVSDALIGISVGTAADIREVTVASTPGKTGVFLGIGAQVNLERADLHGGTDGIRSEGPGIVLNATNIVIWGTTGLALDLPSASGTLSFSTVADSGGETGTGPRAVRCSSNFTVRSSIIWAPGTNARVPIEGCNLVSTIAGPTPAPGAMNFNPLFIDSANRDYHIGPSSPARDAVDSGPKSDFEGDPRPRGAGFDIGADEAP
jgi:hypothetical protein